MKNNLKDYINKKDLDRLMLGLSNLYKEEEVKLEDLFEIDKLCLMKSLEIRSYLEHENIDLTSQDFENYLSNSSKKLDKFNLDFYKKLPISVEVFDKKICIFTPFLFKRMYGSDYTIINFLMAKYVEKALENWLKVNKKDEDFYSKMFDFCEDGKLICEIKRVSKKYHSKAICDNDNIETGRIINTILRKLLWSDNPKAMDLFLRYEETDKLEEGTYFTIMPLKDYKIL